MQSRKTYPDDTLPETGIGLEKERMLSSLFIESPDYGTRLTTYFSMRENGLIQYHERSFKPEDENRFEFRTEDH